jgi:NodT family efflux transporter outer membrane factor (OMF) lipoprotein
MKAKSHVTSAVAAVCVILSLQACTGLPPASQDDILPKGPKLPTQYPVPGTGPTDGSVEWRKFFQDAQLTALIDTALDNNQELKVVLQEIEVARSEIGARQGEYLPFVNLRAGAGVDKAARYTREGVVEHSHEIKEGKEFPEPLPDFLMTAELSWELDIWKKLRNATKAATLRYLSTQEGRHFMVTRLVAEIAQEYYALLALDRRLAIIEQTIRVQENALETVKLQKEAARATELAVRKFEAEVLKNRSHVFEIRQEIVETENRLNFLAGRYPQPVARAATGFDQLSVAVPQVGSPAELLANRPDVRQAELELAAARLDVKVARAQFYPSLGLNAAVGLRSFETASFATTPESLLYRMAADLMVPLFNRKAIRAAYQSASARQLQALYKYQQTVLHAYVEVVTQLAKADNLGQSFSLKRREVDALTDSVRIAGQLFKFARADYMEVLMTQRDALESGIELVELKQQQLGALVKTYQALGGGYGARAAAAAAAAPSGTPVAASGG